MHFAVENPVRLFALVGALATVAGGFLVLKSAQGEDATASQPKLLHTSVAPRARHHRKPVQPGHKVHRSPWRRILSWSSLSSLHAGAWTRSLSARPGQALRPPEPASSASTRSGRPKSPRSTPRSTSAATQPSSSYGGRTRSRSRSTASSTARRSSRLWQTRARLAAEASTAGTRPPFACSPLLAGRAVSAHRRAAQRAQEEPGSESG
jgi:hypothetical protein